MSPAIEPREPRDAVRLLVVDRAAGTTRDREFGDLLYELRPGDVLVVNDAATLPASLMGITAEREPVEVRLIAQLPTEAWRVLLLGEGDWHTRTEDRPAPPTLEPGRRLRFGDLWATVVRTAHASGRLVDLRFDLTDAALWDALYRNGRPVQYSHLQDDLELWSVQTAYAARPWAVEMPSAGRPLTWALLNQLRARGVGLEVLTHAAGLSSTGVAELDADLPLPERYEIPARTVGAIEAARSRGGRVIAVGTSVVRALEGAARHNGGRLSPGAGVTDLIITPAFVPQVVDGLISGIHEPSESHYQLLGAFVPRPLLEAGLRLATERGYQTHEFGDTCLIA